MSEAPSPSTIDFSGASISSLGSGPFGVIGGYVPTYSLPEASGWGVAPFSTTEPVKGRESNLSMAVYFFLGASE